MALSTISKPDQKSYEIPFAPITLTTEMRQNLFELLSEARILFRQLEILFVHDHSAHTVVIQESIKKFNHYKGLVEDFITSE